MTTLTPVKTITYDRLTGDYKMELDGEFVGYAACYHSAEVELDRLAYERLDRAGVEPELTLSATALDGGSSEEIALGTLQTITTPIVSIASLLAQLPSDTDPGHDITLPDPAECPDINAPRPVEDLPATSTYPAWLLGLPDVAPVAPDPCFILPSGNVVQSVILCVGGVSRVVSAQGVAEALALASVHQVTR